MTGRTPLQTPEQVRAFWERWGSEKGFRRHGDLVKPAELVQTGLTVVAYVNDGRWTADCVCGGGIACWPDNPECACLSCGSLYEAAFPDDLEIQQATVTLAARPRRNQHWHPQAERASDLRGDNIRHGFLPEGEEGEAAVPPSVVEQVRARLGDGEEARRAIDLLRREGVI